jgi:hypothetical protein
VGKEGEKTEPLPLRQATLSGVVRVNRERGEEDTSLKTAVCVQKEDDTSIKTVQCATLWVKKRGWHLYKNSWGKRRRDC